MSSALISDIARNDVALQFTDLLRARRKIVLALEGTGCKREHRKNDPGTETLVCWTPRTPGVDAASKRLWAESWAGRRAALRGEAEKHWRACLIGDLRKSWDELLQLGNRRHMQDGTG